jgi:ABC-type multidrug transport system fused ATPase/permease subunit
MNNIPIDDFFSQSKPNLINTSTLQEIDNLLNKNGHLTQQKKLLNDNFYENYIEPNLLFFFAMIILGIFLYYKYILKLEETEDDRINRKKYENKYKREYEEKMQLLNKILEDDLEQLTEKQEQEKQEQEENEQEMIQTMQNTQYNNNYIQNQGFMMNDNYMPNDELNNMWYSDVANQMNNNDSNYGYY